MNDDYESLDFGSDFYTITDEDGNEYEIEHLDTLILDDGTTYMSFTEADEIDDPEMIIFKVVEENGEELFASIEDDDELQSIYDKFMERLYEDGE
jgi:dihydrofolate reductase